MNRNRIVLLVLGLALLAGIASLTFGVVTRAPAPAASGAAAIGGPFQLVDQDGKPIDQRLLDGKWSAVFFGYTFCPDVCPTTLQSLGAAQRLLGSKADKLQMVFVSVDPDRDTPKQLKAYLSDAAFAKGIVGLTGTPAQVAAVAKAYGVYYAKDGSGPDYAVNHSSAIYLMDPKGRFDRVVAAQMAPRDMAAQISDAMDHPAS